jgi:pimeloyl-ACP methyl ester carboxylesterase
VRNLIHRVGLTLALATSSTAVPAQVRDAAPGSAMVNPAASRTTGTTWVHVPTQTLSAGGITFAYRELGKQHGGTPVIFLNHLAAVLDNWDPRVVDGIAATHHVIVFDNRGVGASTGSPSNSMEQMADDAITFAKGMGFRQVDLFGFSMGGMVAQEIVAKEPQLVRRMILAGTGPAGGEGISAVAGVANYDLLRGLFTGQDPKQYLFFTRTANGIEADLSVVKQPVLIVNGDDDRMVPTPNSHDLARRLPNSTLIIYPDSGHGGVFQNHTDFVPKALDFLAR